MRLDHPDYIKLVKATYNKKRADNELSTLLAQPTPANIRQECWYVYKKQYDSRQLLKKDEQILNGFFGPVEPGKQFLEAIGNFPADRFRPLDNYLKGDTEKTDRSNLELLAWLIDFRHRPYVFGMEVILNEDEISIIGKPEINTRNGQPHPVPKPVPIEKDQKKNRRRIIIIFLIVATCLGGGYFIWQKEQSKHVPLGILNTACMYWKDDHYEEIPCNDERKSIFKLPMDAEKMRNFKRITQEDTITEKSIGKVYYFKMDNKREYYTTSGHHPVYVTRNLKPLSRFIFDTYLRKPEIATKDSVTK